MEAAYTRFKSESSSFMLTTDRGWSVPGLLLSEGLFCLCNSCPQFHCGSIPGVKAWEENSRQRVYSRLYECSQCRLFSPSQNLQLPCVRFRAGWRHTPRPMRREPMQHAGCKGSDWSLAPSLQRPLQQTSGFRADSWGIVGQSAAREVFPWATTILFSF